MRIITLIIILIGFSNISFAQIKHETKLEGLRAIFRNFIPSYEIIPTKRIGIEIECGLDDWEMQLRDTLNNDKDIGYNQLLVSPSIGGKYYLLFTDYGNGVFIGPYARADYILTKDDDFNKHYESLNNKPSPKYLEKGLSQIFYGIQGGFKILIKSNFILEATGRYMVEEQKPEERTIHDTYYRAEIYFKVGYRF